MCLNELSPLGPNLPTPPNVPNVMFEKNYERRRKFQETWATKIPWAKLVAYTLLGAKFVHM